MAFLGAAVSAAAAVVSAFFAIAVLTRFIETRKPHNLMWAIGLTMFMLASLVQFLSEVSAWTVGAFKAWYVLGTGLVGFLGAGSVYIAHRRIGHAFAGFVILLFAVFVAIAAISAVDSALVQSFSSGSPPDPAAWKDASARRLSPFFTIPGSFALIGIALVGLVRYRLTYNAYIAGGAVVLAVGTGLSRFGVPSLIYAAELVGIAIMFFGFLRAIEWARDRAKGTPLPPTPVDSGEPAPSLSLQTK